MGTTSFESQFWNEFLSQVTFFGTNFCPKLHFLECLFDVPGSRTGHLVYFLHK